MYYAPCFVLVEHKDELIDAIQSYEKTRISRHKVLPDLNIASFFVFIKMCCLLFKFYVSITFDPWILISSVFNQKSGNRDEKDVSKLYYINGLEVISNNTNIFYMHFKVWNECLCPGKSLVVRNLYYQHFYEANKILKCLLKKKF